MKKEKPIFLLIVISFVIVSIVMYNNINNDRIIKETIVMRSYSRPWITATPISSNKDIHNLTEIIKPYYLLDNCDFISIEQSPTKLPKLDFIEDNISFDQGNINVMQIADNLNKSYRAYLIDEEIACPGQTNTCFRSRIYIDEQAFGKVYKLNWIDFEITRPIIMMIWVGNNTLTFLQSMGPHGVLLFGIGVEEKSFVYYSRIGGCP